MHHPTTVTKPGTISVPAFFEEVCPTLLASWPDGHGGAVGFSIEGAEAGEWIVDLTERRVAPRGDRRADLEIAMTMQSFERMTTGDLDLTATDVANRLDVAGDIDLLLDLSILLRRVAEGSR